MGRIKQGANGGFSGKAGSVIGSSWKDVDYIKGRPKTSSKPKTQLQLQQQLKFALGVQFLKPIKDLLNFTFNSLRSGRAFGFNMALRHVLANAIDGTYPDYEINYANVKISEGPLAIATGTAVAEEGGIVRVTWNPQLNVHNGFVDDQITVLIYDPATNIYINGLSGITRSEGEMEIVMRPEMIGETVHVYYFFTARDGKRVSPSKYAGEVIPL